MNVQAAEVRALHVGPKTQNDNFLENALIFITFYCFMENVSKI
jgi:hypothetical protein